MSTKARIVVLVVSLLAVLAPSAQAVTWHNSGDTAFTAVGPLGGFGTLSATGLNVACNQSITGTTGTSPFVGTTWTAMQVTAQYTGCLMAGVPFNMDCQQALTAESQSGGVTSGSLDTFCEGYMFNFSVCRFEGSQAVTYTNPSGAPGTFLLPATTGLRSTDGADGTCPMGNGDTVSWTARSLTVALATGGPAPHTGPVLTRTP
jgi:hypothetical protein